MLSYMLWDSAKNSALPFLTEPCIIKEGMNRRRNQNKISLLFTWRGALKTSKWKYLTLLKTRASPWGLQCKLWISELVARCLFTFTNSVSRWWVHFFGCLVLFSPSRGAAARTEMEQPSLPYLYALVLPPGARRWLIYSDNGANWIYLGMQLYKTLLNRAGGTWHRTVTHGGAAV